MLTLLTIVVTGVLALWLGVQLVRRELSRRGQPATSDASAWFTARVGLLIVLLSTFGALLAWRTSTVAGQAGGLAQQGMQDAVQLDEATSRLDNRIASDTKLAAMLTESALVEQQLNVQLNNPKLGASDADRQRMEHAAREEHRVVATVRRLIRGSGLEEFDNPVRNFYDGDRDRTLARERTTELRTLHPAAKFSAADRARRKAFELAGVGALLVVALFFLTISTIAGTRRFHAAVAGTAAMSLGFVLYMAIELLA